MKFSTLMPILSDTKWFILIHIYPVSLFPSVNIRLMIHWVLALVVSYNSVTNIRMPPSPSLAPQVAIGSLSCL